MGDLLTKTEQIFGNRERRLIICGQPPNLTFFSGHFRLVHLFSQQPSQPTSQKNQKLSRAERRRETATRKKKGHTATLHRTYDEDLAPEFQAVAVGLTPVLIATFREVLDSDCSAKDIFSVMTKEGASDEKIFDHETYYAAPWFADSVIQNFFTTIRKIPEYARECLESKGDKGPIYQCSARKGDNLVIATFGDPIPSIQAHA